MTLEIGVALVLGLAAMITDLRTRTIPNWIPASALAGGILCQTLGKGWPGLLSAGIGAAAGFGVFLIFYLLGGMGGGDVKLMAGFGSLLGTGRVIEAAFWTAGVGGVMALAVIGGSWARSKFRRGETRLGPKAIPYAPAIACGVWLALIPKG